MTATASPLAELSASFADLAAATTPSIVEVQSRHSLASGFVWRDGLVITPTRRSPTKGRSRSRSPTARCAVRP